MLNLNGITSSVLPSIEPDPAPPTDLDFEEALDTDPDYLAFLFTLEQSDLEAELAG